MLTKNFQRLRLEVESHITADAIAQADTPHASSAVANQSDDPQYIENTYGIPKMVSRMAESIFEGLPADEAPAFFAAFPDAVGRDGKDLSRVPWQFLAAELRELPPVENDIQAVIDLVIRGMKLLAEGKVETRRGHCGGQCYHQGCRCCCHYSQCCCHYCHCCCHSCQ